MPGTLYKGSTGNGYALHLAAARSTPNTPALCGRRVWTGSTEAALSDLPAKACRRCETLAKAAL